MWSQRPESSLFQKDKVHISNSNYPVRPIFILKLQNQIAHTAQLFKTGQNTPSTQIISSFGLHHLFMRRSLLSQQIDQPLSLSPSKKPTHAVNSRGRDPSPPATSAKSAALPTAPRGHESSDASPPARPDCTARRGAP
jgi:hypothetical protein